MKRSDGYYWNLENAQGKDFVWSSNNFEQGISTRQQLAKFNKTRPCNVKLIDVIIAVLKSIF